MWNNLHDGMSSGRECAETPERFDYDTYLDFPTRPGDSTAWRYTRRRRPPGLEIVPARPWQALSPVRCGRR